MTISFKAISLGKVKTSAGEIELLDCGVPEMSIVVSSANVDLPQVGGINPPGEVGTIMKKAKAGDGFFQTVLSEHYRDGNGVPRDLAQAKFWAECACTNHEADATNLLEQINKKLTRP